MTERRNAKTRFTRLFADRLSEAIREGRAPWQQDWKPGEMPLPLNGITGRRYRGGNMLMLLGTGRLDPRWAGFGQMRNAGGHVRKNEKGIPILIIKHPALRAVSKDNLDHLDRDSRARVDETETRPRTYYGGAWIFSFEQADGLPAMTDAVVPITENEAGRRLDRIIARTAVPIRHAEHAQPGYNTEKDEVLMPTPDRFEALDGYRQTLLHEIAHATGHPSRMNRWRNGRAEKNMRSREYATEELRAEIAAMLVGQKLGVGHSPDLRNAEAYVAGWLDGLEKDPEAIHRAVGEAQAIADWLSGTGA